MTMRLGSFWPFDRIHVTRRLRRAASGCVPDDTAQNHRERGGLQPHSAPL